MSAKLPVIGNIFSSDSSDEVSDRISLSDKGTSVSRIPIGGRGAISDASTVRKTFKSMPPPPEPVACPDGYTLVEPNRISSLATNIQVQYETKSGKFVKTKYFKKYDTIMGTVVLGFYKHNKRNYTESVSKIKFLYAKFDTSNGGQDELKDTIELPRDQWKTIRRDMVITYEKENHEMIHRAKFNAFLKGTDGSSKFSLTSERGYSYVANPDKISKIYRHVTSNDKTLTYILDAVRKLELRVRTLEARLSKKK